MIKFLIVLIVLLGIVAVSQLMRVYELSSKLRNKREEDISAADNKLNANLMLAFMIGLYIMFIWLIAKYGTGGLPVAASEHGVETDALLLLNFYIITAIFFLTNTLLFYFAYKYSYNKNRKALFYPHNNKLELLWTVVPAAVLAVIIILGLRTWNAITADSPEDATRVEVYAKQFSFTVRYSGENNVLGSSDFRMVSGTNPVGVQTTALIKARIEELNAEIAGWQLQVDNAANPTSPEHIITDVAACKAKNTIDRLMRHVKKLERMLQSQTEQHDQNAFDDVIATTELRLVKGRAYEFLFRSQDVIHSAYFPHFRAQMNMVPGMTTRLKMVPTITTDSMRIITGDPKFDYVLICNKICGLNHSKMKLQVIVEDEKSFAAWMKEQATVGGVATEVKNDSLPVVPEVIILDSNAVATINE